MHQTGTGMAPGGLGAGDHLVDRPLTLLQRTQRWQAEETPWTVELHRIARSEWRDHQPAAVHRADVAAAHAAMGALMAETCRVGSGYRHDAVARMAQFQRTTLSERQYVG